MSILSTDQLDRKITLTPEQAIQKWFRTHKEPLSKIIHQVSVVRNTPTFRGGFDKGLLALANHLFVNLLIKTFPDITAPDNQGPQKTKFELYGQRFAVGMTCANFDHSKAKVTLKSNYDSPNLPEQELFADYMLLIQTMDFEKDQPIRFMVINYDTLRQLPTKWDKLKNIELQTRHIHTDHRLVDITFENPYDLDQPMANTLIQRALDTFLGSLAGIASELIEY